MECVTTSAVCNHCGKSVDPSRDEACPHCGQYADKRIGVTVTDGIGVEDSVSWAGMREFLSYNRVWAIVLAAIVLVSPFVGRVVGGAWGIPVGLFLGLLSVPVGYLAFTKVREITRGGDL